MALGGTVRARLGVVLGGAGLGGGLGEAAWNFFCLGGLNDFKN